MHKLSFHDLFLYAMIGCTKDTLVAQLLSMRITYKRADVNVATGNSSFVFKTGKEGLTCEMKSVILSTSVVILFALVQATAATGKKRLH